MSSLYSGLYAALAFFAVAHTTAILAAIFSARVLRLMRGGRRLCCNACDCACCCACCCSPPPVGDAARLARARGLLRAALCLAGVTALCAAAAAAAVGIGSSSYASLAGSTFGLVTTSTIGVGLSAFACVLSAAALTTGLAAHTVLTEDDVKNADGPLGVYPNGGTVILSNTVQMSSPLQNLPSGVSYASPQGGYMVTAATSSPIQPVAYSFRSVA